MNRLCDRVGLTAAPLTILVDHRERRSGVVEALSNRSIEVVFARLPVGDYVVSRGVGVERKTVADLHRSLRDGRLWNQIASLAIDLDAAYLLVEGTNLDRGSVSRAGIRGALVQATELGLTVLRSSDPDDSGLWLERLAARRAWIRAPRVRRRSRSCPDGSPASMLCQIPGISPRIAGHLLNRFGDVAGVAAASPVQLMAIPWIGLGRAAAIKRHLTSDGRTL